MSSLTHSLRRPPGSMDTFKPMIIKVSVSQKINHMNVGMRLAGKRRRIHQGQEVNRRVRFVVIRM